jgi:hypothetical protein
VASEWIERELRPQLAGLATRPWVKGSLGPFLADLHQQVNAARESGLLSREDEVTARDLIREAIKTIPGVTFVTHTGSTSVTVAGTLRRRDPDESAS